MRRNRRRLKLAAAGAYGQRRRNFLNLVDLARDGDGASCVVSNHFGRIGIRYPNKNEICPRGLCLPSDGSSTVSRSLSDDVFPRCFVCNFVRVPKHTASTRTSRFITKGRTIQYAYEYM